MLIEKSSSLPTVSSTQPMPDGHSQPLHVLAISPGIAIGPVRLFHPASNLPDAEDTTISVDQVDAEWLRLQKALDAAIQELRELIEHVAHTVGRDEADIFEAQQLMLEDPDLLEEIEELLKQQHLSASSALKQASEHQALELEALDNEMLAARAADIRDVTSRVLRHLHNRRGDLHGRPPSSPSPALLVAYDLTPSDTAGLNPQEILGICTVVGGPTTHAAILARALEIPAIAGLDSKLLQALQNDQIIAIDGSQGLLYTSLTVQQQQAFQTTMQKQQRERHERRSHNQTYWRNRPGSTADGFAVPILANVGDLESARAAGENGAEGIGLLRTEFLFGNRPHFPDEQEQYDSYLALFHAFADASNANPIIVARTLDAGADKPFPALEPLIGTLHEVNPALGLRGVRIHLSHEELLRQQLRALLRAGSAANISLHIMFPMICTLEEIRHLRTIYMEECQELQAAGISLRQDTQLGIMIETPAAAIMADVLAREVDFFSIGANDLFQYTMAADRTNSRVMSMFGMLEPAVWRLIDSIVRAAKAHNTTVTLCGELAAHPRIGPLLAGSGVQELSMSPPAIANVKAALHTQSMAYWQHMAQTLLKAETAEEMQAVLVSLS
ncbi:MAG TPA: phosphoenolpyruvate--protein phosphotransferase [Ktedonobacteraceae bacterium]|nr:phosphoenolpyruvate--protein phosphotransferase [Ktedonobacteraceae bacterium]